ncbi:RICIN domain-containing protein [Methanolobus sp.]|uniref:RICIN domain-containing protein n=1 Tax=Methanolobus sp. TaxID=1874737 RepID=UPI0025F7F997|nr:RICIN domain-containing protein [Methanolobus sp.]
MTIKTATLLFINQRNVIQLFALFTIFLLIGSGVYPAMAASSDDDFLNATFTSSSITPFEVSALNAMAQTVAFANQRDTGIDLDSLLAAINADTIKEKGDGSSPLLLSTDFSEIDMDPAKYGPDTDGDGIPDSIELVLGTDPNNPDSDFDRLDDLYEIQNGLDSLKPDSNDDGLADYFEVTGVHPDVDGDGFPNAWDLDNDNDGVIDALDLSPFSKSSSMESFDFNLKSDGSPTYLNFQIRPEDPDNLKLLAQSWDWPDGDSRGTMKDLNNSKDDVIITPMLELTVPMDCKIVSVDSGECLEAPLAVYGEQLNVTTGNCTGTDSQLWKLESQDGKYYSIVSRNDSRCLEVFNASQDDQANITLGNFTGQDHQLWELELNGNGFYKLIAKNSGKCLEAGSGPNGSTVQNTCQETDRQLWELELTGGIASDPDALKDYGLVVTLGKAYLPLSPVKDFGNIVALNGRMFYPQGLALETSTQVQLKWIVTGKTDRPKKVTLRSYSGEYISLDSATSKLKLVTTNSVTNNEIFEIVYLNNNDVALKASNGKYVYAVDGGGGRLMADSSEISEYEIFEMLDPQNGKVSLKADNGKYVSASPTTLSSGGLVATKLERSEWEDFTLTTIESESVSATMATYNEDFSLTGFTIEGNHGSDVGLFYSEDKERIFEAALLLSYAFLRGQTSLDQMPEVLEDYNVTVSSQIDSAGHQDEALAKMTGEMTPDALSALPAGLIVPVIGIFEDNFRHQTMDELDSGSHVTGNSFDIDLTDRSLMTTKSMKMTWYDTDTREVVATEDMLEEVMQWGQFRGLDEDTLATMMSLVLAWGTGEYVVTRIGNVEMDFNLPEKIDVMSTIKKTGMYVLGGIKAVCILITGAVAVYSYITFIRLEPLAATAGQTGFKLLQAMFQSVSKISNGFMGLLNRISNTIAIIGIIVVAGLAFYAFWTIASEEGWSSFGVGVGAWYAILMILYTVALMAIAAIPVVGWAIALLIALSDLIVGWILGESWSQKLFGWIISLVTKVKVKTELDMQMLETSVNVNDRTNNGLTEGDRIEMESTFKGIVTTTSHGSTTNLQNSYISPQYLYSAAYTLDGGTSTTAGTPEYKYPWQKETRYYLELWVEPEAAADFPFMFWLKTSYNYYYDKCWWLFGWHCSENSDTGTSDSEPSTIYFDVMPNDIGNFTLWTAISSNDIDGDYVLNTDELRYGTSPFRWDTDNDGLSDGYEIAYGTSPVNRDADGDGLEDGLELRYGYDPLLWDTDGDGLSDFVEHNGWEMEFDFYGETFTQHVWSSPLNEDTDGDGLSDFMEFLRGLNPRSKDTNGNGILDPYDMNFTSKAYVSKVDMNSMDSNIKVDPETNITAVIDYALIGKVNSTGEPSQCWLFVSLDNSTLHEEIYNGTPAIGNETFGSATLNFSAPNGTDIFALRFYQTWNVSVPAPAEEDREVIGIIDTHEYPDRGLGWVSSGEDKDKDNLIDLNEQIGWPVSLTNSSGTYTIHVTSDPRFKDSDFDGLDDHTECYITMSDPGNYDTDGDGLGDFAEYYLGTDPTNHDTDGDGLDDGTEVFYGSDPLLPDTDSDGLDDLTEYLLSSNPRKADTDNDGLTDLEEHIFGSNLLKPDSDDDGLFDYLERAYGTDPNDHDTDGDGLSDGYEVHGAGTSPLLQDTDSDGLTDPEELELYTNPLTVDTDGDGFTDYEEIELCTNPLLEDTDGDNLKDSLDADSLIPDVKDIAVVYDVNEKNEKLRITLERYTNVKVYSADDFLSNHTDEPYVLLLGTPQQVNGTAGKLIWDVLANDGDVLQNMIDSPYDRMAVRYGVWNATQTVFMLSDSYMYDHCRIMHAFRSTQVTTSASSVRVDYSAPQNILLIESVDCIKKTDSSVGIVLDANVTPWVSIKLLGSSAFPLTSGSGLASVEYAVGKYLDVTVSENVQNTSISIMNSTLLTIYYRSGELDKNMDGDISDPYDIDENTLCLYYLNEDTRKWVKLPYTGVNIDDVEIYGENYAGYVWARVSHLSTFSLAGRTIQPDRGPLDSDLDGLSNIAEYRIGTDPFNPDTDGDGIIDSLDPEPLIPFSSVVEEAVANDGGFKGLSEEADLKYTVPQESTLAGRTSVPGYMMWLIFTGIVALLSYLIVFRRKG